MKRIQILITESRELFKTLEDRLIYIEVDRDTNSIIYVSGIDSNETIYMMLEDVLNQKGFYEYKKGLDYVLANPIDIYESYIGESIFLFNTVVINEFWIIGLQPSNIVQIICNKLDRWDGLETDFISMMNLPMVLFREGKVIFYNETFMSSLIYFEDIESLLLQVIEEYAPLNILQDKDSRLIPIIMKRTKNNKYIFILLLPIKLLHPSVSLPVVTNESNSDFNKEEFGSLVKMEVELKQMEIRIKQLEKFAYLERNGIASRLKEIEVYQDQDNQKWLQLDVYKTTIEDKIVSLILMNTIIKNFPGGPKGFLVLITCLVLMFLTLIDISIRHPSVKDTIDYIDKNMEND